ncbi:MAG: cell division protein FtsL [Myxococcota bacterium]|jgi:cell division protein FtsL
MTSHRKRNAGRPVSNGAKTTRKAAKQTRLRLPLGVGRFLVLVAFTVGMTGLGLYKVHSQYEVIQVGYSLDRELFEHRRLFEAQKRLNLMLSAYKDPAAVRAFAEDELEMTVPGPTHELHVPNPDDDAPNPSLFGGLLDGFDDAATGRTP